ncbi:phosphonate C-P lyase system protein PhnG [Corynebacterium doosanense]|uniref:Phosphonate metabolism protein PhnG n=1 Tax=Corynebacterium doosanense CAU 212 = DSM 45436 TaxID=558173 RepID=A0A097IFM6_9CORY|nr:phosphonate C-P lyase system protein PhnG [Corynebacterium doosanense]AIT60941.1 phosphonate metabolism protein PhnG [Corynebacterium doosanense CAU 212 = DSM 45436]
MDTTEDNREDVLGLLARGDRQRLCELADTILDQHVGAGGDFSVIRDPVAGVLTTQVREPLAGQRFLRGDILVSQAEVVLGGSAGWGMCFGDDRASALALAICDTEIARAGELADDVRALARETDRTLRERRAAERERLRPTIVEFEEIA